MIPSSLKNAFAESDQPTIVVLNAADLNIGAVDRFAELIPMARAANAWVHIDGAFGLFARASHVHRHLLEGVELADSWATDAHKWLNVPFDCGVAIVRDRDAHQAAMTLQVSYVSAHSQARDQIDWNPEWSRRARGIPVYAALRELGRDGVEDLVDRCCEYCSALATGIGSLAGASVLVAPTLNQALVHFHDPTAQASLQDDNAYTDEVIRRINDTGEAFFSGTEWKGQRAMRISVVNWRTNREDVDRAVAAVASVLGATRESQ